MTTQMPDLRAVGSQQLTAISDIPGAVLANWPSWFSFSVVNYVESVIIRAIPNVSGIAGTVVNAALRGAVQVTQMVTWEKTRTGKV